MSNEVETLMEMGFPRNRAEKALVITGNQGVPLAMDWLFAHADDPDIDKPYNPSEGQKLGTTVETPSDNPPGSSDSTTPTTDDKMETAQSGQSGQTDDQSEAGPSTDNTPQQALSLVCEDCGKKMRNEDEVQFHAAKTGHANFAESSEAIKPLTEEEKKIRMEKLQQRLAERRQEKKEQEKQEAIDKEKMRRRTGKEITEMKHKMELEEAKKLADLKKRERQEEKLARQKVREQIARDKAERALKFGKASQSRQSTPAVVQPPQVVQTEKKEYNTCKIQFRLTNGSTMTGSFQATDTLSTVTDYVSANRTDGGTPFALMTSFPRKTFTAADMSKTLKDAGLVPSAVLILTKL